MVGHPLARTSGDYLTQSRERLWGTVAAQALSTVGNSFTKPFLLARSEEARDLANGIRGFPMLHSLLKQQSSVSRAYALRPLSRLAVGVLAGAGLLWASGVAAGQSADLVTLINDYRASSAPCAGQEMAGTGPLAPNSTLAGLNPSSTDWQVALQQSGYQASAAQFVQLSGPADAEQAMEMIQGRFCKVLRSEQYAEIGVSRSGNEWQVVLASPLVSREFVDRDWMDVGQEVLAEVNLARREARACGDQAFAAANPLTWDARLARAAFGHSGYMADNGVLSHAGPTGEQVQARVDEVNYEWRKLGENVAVGQSSPKQVVAAWLHSPGHCANIMNPEFTDMGAAFETRPQSSIFWTQVFGSER